MVYHIKKYKYDGTDIEYITPEDIFFYGKEDDSKLQYFYMFLNTVAKEFNYYNHNTSTAFGNPDLEFYRGQIRGWMQAKQWEWDEKITQNGVVVFVRSSSGRTIFKIEKPNIPKEELVRRKEIATSLNALGL